MLTRALSMYNDRHNNWLVYRTTRLRSRQSGSEHSLHSHVVEDDTSQHSHVPDIMRAADVIEEAGEKALRRLARVETRTGDVDEKALGDGRVKVLCPLDTAGVGELAKGEETGEGE